jgi:YVTN family beta-propeller protein
MYFRVRFQRQPDPAYSALHQASEDDLMNRIKLALTVVTATFPALGLAAQLLVLSKDEATLAFIDPVSGKTQATVATGNGPHEVEVSSDAGLAFVSNYGAGTEGNSLSVIDVKSRKEVKRVDLGDLRRPHGLTLLDGNVYFTAEAARRVGRYDPKAQRVDWTFDTGQDVTHMVLASRDGTKLFTSNIRSNTISIIDKGPDGAWKQTLVTVGAGPEGLDQSPDGRELWTAHSRDGRISIIDVATKKVTQTFDAKTKRSNRLKFTPDGKWVLVSDLGSGELVVIDARTHAERTRLSVPSATGILVAPNGKEAYVAASGGDHIAVIDLTTMSLARKIETASNPDGMAWVP